MALKDFNWPLMVLIVAAPLFVSPHRAAAAPYPDPRIGQSAAPGPGKVSDIALAPGGVLTGQLSDSSGQPLAGVDVQVQTSKHAVATTRTDENGVFAVTGLRGGVHQIVAGDSAAACRFWTAGTAPPKAASALRLVRDGSVVRGQFEPPGMLNSMVQGTAKWATNPFVIGGVVATAVAIPVAINNLDDDDPPGS